MTFTVTVESFCTGGEHVNLTLHIDGVGDRPATTTKTDLLDDDVDDTKAELVRQRLKSFCLENWAGSWANLKTAIEAAEFKV
jgi:hypothetical protein